MPYLTVISGPDKGKSLELVTGETYLIGRDPKGNLCLEDLQVSRQHAKIIERDNRFYILDLKSTNKTFVNNRVVKTEQLLNDGDYIKMGDTLLIFTEKIYSLEPSIPEPSVVEPEISEELYESIMEIKLDLEKEMADKLLTLGKEEEDKVAKVRTQVRELTSDKLSTLYQISRIVATEKDAKNLLNQALKLTVEATKADQGYIILLEKETDKLKIEASYRAKSLEDLSPASKISRTIIKRVIENYRPLLTSDAMLDNRLSSSHSVVMSNIKSVICVPMFSAAKFDGVIYLVSNKLGWSFTQPDLELVTSVAIQVGMALANQSALAKARQSLINLIKTMIALSEIKDPKTQGHAERVANFSLAIANELGLAKAEVYNIYLAALLHDIGKIAVTSDVITSRDIKHKSEHVVQGEKILSSLEDFQEILPGIKYHHERLDGTGFPYQIKGDQIPLMAKIIAVANTLDNLLAYGGPLGQGLPIKEVLIEINQQAGQEFDPTVVKALMSAQERGTLFSTVTPFEEFLFK